MDRRESIRSLFLGSIAGGLALESCVTTPTQVINEKIWEYQYGRTPKEALHDEKLLKEAFFSDEEFQMITRLANIILPPSEDGTIEEAEVPEFIEFMIKDFSDFKIPIRGGLMSLNAKCNRKYGNHFLNCSENEQLSVLDLIAYPDPKLKEQKQEVQFFSLLRNLVLTGYFTSKIGIAELGYKGNQPNIWDGVPEDVLEQYGLKYDAEWIAKCIDQSKRDDIAVWDESGNLLT